ncbi:MULTISPECIES: PucR family transcriptional regulator ligand-binding domain-containing protein [Streptomyces]|uniref:PucR family transcriptional regulator ligand-binding domain-containing protein n=1 Tax=Streptomyces TaxID=1883 RepID=UPI002DDA3064|nr:MULTISPECIES: PucR family transcriptional regulator ligand-binding domain-containing protein [unclassified Streptomyces]WSD98134.1 PucR family transcriptional regulator [Streptomyces sp. NBC_01474]
MPDATRPAAGPPGPSVPPAPAVPPTPPVPLTALLAREDLGLRQIAGPPVGPDTVIHWAHTSEMADPYPYLLGGELLLTAGVHATESAGTGPYYDDYVARIVAAGGAALGFGVAPVHDTVPRALVEACDRHGLPLFEVPPHSTFSGVTRAVWQLMAQARHAELRRVSEAQQGLATAAARPYPVPAVLRQLAQRTSGWTVLTAPDGTEVGRAGPDPSAEVSAAMAQLMRIVRPGETRLFPAPTSAADTVGGTQLAAYALGGGQGYALGTAVGHRDPGDHTIAGVAVVLLSLLTGEHQTTAEAARSAALVRLLLGEEPAAVAALLGDGTWRVVHAAPDRPSPPPVSLGTPLLDATDSLVRALLPADQEVVAQEGWMMGVSGTAPTDDLAAADAQASRALTRAKATRAPLVHHHADARGLASLLDPGEVTAHARTLLAPIAHTPALTETLRTWLSLHGSWDRTATALAVHRNTVRQRIAKCATLLDTDLDDPDVRMELWFALRHTE